MQVVAITRDFFRMISPKARDFANFPVNFPVLREVTPDASDRPARPGMGSSSVRSGRLAETGTFEAPSALIRQIGKPKGVFHASALPARPPRRGGACCRRLELRACGS